MAEVQKIVIDGDRREDAYQIQNSETRGIPRSQNKAIFRASEMAF